METTRQSLEAEMNAPARRCRARRGKRSPRAASEILVTNRDGTTRTVVRARAWSDWLKRRVETESPGIASATLIRELTREEYLAIKPAYRRDKDGPRALAFAPAEGPASPVAAIVPSTPDIAPAPRPIAPEKKPAPPAPFAWEVLVRQHGKPRTMRVVGATEAGSVELVMALDGVDAAVAIRPLSPEEYRRAAM